MNLHLSIRDAIHTRILDISDRLAMLLYSNILLRMETMAVTRQSQKRYIQIYLATTILCSKVQIFSNTY